MGTLYASMGCFCLMHCVFSARTFDVGLQVYCGTLGETLVATFNDRGGDGYCCKFGGGSYYSVFVGG